MGCHQWGDAASRAGRCPGGRFFMYDGLSTQHRFCKEPHVLRFGNWLHGRDLWWHRQVHYEVETHALCPGECRGTSMLRLVAIGSVLALTALVQSTVHSPAPIVGPVGAGGLGSDRRADDAGEDGAAEPTNLEYVVRTTALACHSIVWHPTSSSGQR